MSEESLGRMPPGAKAVIDRVRCDRPLRRRLFEMGLLPGTPVEVVRVAPLGDPLEIRVRGYALSIRRNEAARIDVREVSR